MVALLKPAEGTTDPSQRETAARAAPGVNETTHAERRPPLCRSQCEQPRSSGCSQRGTNWLRCERDQVQLVGVDAFTSVSHDHRAFRVVVQIHCRLEKAKLIGRNLE